MPSHSANNQELKEESAPTANQVTQRTQKEEAPSQIKSSGDVSAQQEEPEIKEENQEEKKSPGKDSERDAKRAGTIQQGSAKFLGDNNDKTRRTSTHTNRKPSTVKVEVQPAESSRKEIESQAAKSENEEEKAESASQIQGSNRGDHSQREQTPKEKEGGTVEKNNEGGATVKEGGQTEEENK